MLRSLNNSLPIGRQLAVSRSKSVNQNVDHSMISLENQIANLEKSLHDESSDDESSDDIDNGSSFDEIDHDSLLLQKDSNGNIVKIKSALSLERIMPLPKSLLPDAQCKTSIRSSEELDSLNRKRGDKKRIVAFEDEEGSKNLTKMMPPAKKIAKPISGLESTVREMLKNYKPASIEKLPFYCRVCQFQGDNVEALTNHRISEEHETAVAIERKMSFCKLCRKQFTSPDQLKEHLKGKLHVEKVLFMKERQSQMKKFC